MIKRFLNSLIQKHLRIIFIALIIMGNLHVAFATDEKTALLENLDRTVYNFHQVSPELYRSGLISEESVPYLKELGIKTVVSFDNRSWRAERESKFLDGSGIEFISLPWSGWDYPKDETIEQIHKLMEESGKSVLVHCKHGQERTGVVIATWKIAKEGWTADQAFHEMKTYGFRPVRYGHLKQYVYDFASRHGDQNARIGVLERTKTNVLSFFYQLRKFFI